MTPDLDQVRVAFSPMRVANQAEFGAPTQETS